MKNARGNKPTQIVKGNIFDALGFSASEASALRSRLNCFQPFLNT